MGDGMSDAAKDMRERAAALKQYDEIKSTVGKDFDDSLAAEKYMANFIKQELEKLKEIRQKRFEMMKANGWEYNIHGMEEFETSRVRTWEIENLIKSL